MFRRGRNGVPMGKAGVEVRADSSAISAVDTRIVKVTGSALRGLAPLCPALPPPGLLPTLASTTARRCGSA